ncbi:MAG: hypothetical protein JRM77_04815 [Nitrososphaerota archaeon]|nr:hypothetical protein [Nitrososphaerota archaeon]
MERLVLLKCLYCEAYLEMTLDEERDALLYLPFLLLAAWSIRGIESHGRHIGEVLNE